MAYAAKKQAKIYDNQLKQCRRRGRGISNETPSGQKLPHSLSPLPSRVFAEDDEGEGLGGTGALHIAITAPSLFAIACHWWQ